jgi:aspartyl-tRNA(Asn)/glutamyl-tRNA(Gln) amidotransferase subunit A
MVYQAMRGPDPLDVSTDRTAPYEDVLTGLRDGVRGLRLAFAETVFWDEVDHEVAQAVRACGDVLANLGAHVSSILFPEAAEAIEVNSNGIISAVEAYREHQERLGDRIEDYDPVVTYRIAIGRDATANDYLRTLQACAALRARAQWALRDVDAFLVPTTMVPALPQAQVDASLEAYKYWNPRYSRNTRVGNVLGLCALTVPCGFSSQGLPIGLMICTKGFDEAMALRVGYAYEQATAWHRQTPDLSWVTTPPGV